MVHNAHNYADVSYPSTQTIGGRTVNATADIVDNSMSTAQISGAISNLAGSNVLNQVTAINLHACGGNAGANLSSQDQGLNAKGQIQEARSNFAQQQAQVQNTVGAAIKQAAADGNMDMNVVNNTYKAPSESTGVSLMANATTGFNMASAVYELRSAMQEKLSNEQKAELADRVCRILAPPPGQEGQAPSHNLNQSYIAQQQGRDAAKMLDEIYKPLDRHPEMIALSNAEKSIDYDLNHHFAVQDDNEATVQTAQKYDVSTADFNIQSSGALNQQYIQDCLAEQAEWGIDQALVETRSFTLPPIENTRPYNVYQVDEKLASLEAANKIPEIQEPEYRPPEITPFRPSMLNA